MLIHPSVEEDYISLFDRRMWFVHGSPMTISKWAMDFKVNQEISIALVWVTFPDLPIPFFRKLQLSKLALTLGR